MAIEQLFKKPYIKKYLIYSVRGRIPKDERAVVSTTLYKEEIVMWERALAKLALRYPAIKRKNQVISLVIRNLAQENGITITNE